ncbi:hypothetical protein ACHWQZ_G000744 [Mnemiopsis leidyi]
MTVLKLILLLLKISLSFSYLGWRRRRSSCSSITGRWSSWSVWSICTCSADGVATKTRHRYCTNPEASCGGRECYGESQEFSSCVEVDLAVNGGWSTWGPWSSCLCELEGEMKSRDRKCDNPAPSCGGSTCEGSSRESRVCAVDGGWAVWGEWTECKCDHGSGTGVRTRTRSCTDPIPACLGRDCIGESEEFVSCDDLCCVTVEGGWTDWTDWSECECDHSTGTGTRNKTRSCSNPSPSCFGRSCAGESTMFETCDDQCCVTVDGNWGVWGAWSDNCFCDHESGEGHFIRKRTCSDPLPSCFGLECIGNSIDVKVCSEQCCQKIDGNWSGWGLWSETCRCDHSSGTGHRNRNRTCSDPIPDCGGKDCEGVATELKDCSIDCCVTVEGGWTDWTDWNECECDHSTGTGTRNKTRSCSNPSPSCFGRQCGGDKTAIEVCSDECCRTINGGWTDWTEWNECECDHSTGTGTRNKTRSCSNPSPSCFGSDCAGDSVNTSFCDSYCGPCDRELCEKDPTCNLEECSGDEDGTGSAIIAVDECGVDEFDLAGNCLKLYVGGLMIGVAVLLIVLATGVVIYRKRNVEKEVPYVVENQSVVNRREFEVVDEGVLTISDRDVRYRANCCQDDSDADGDYQIFTNENVTGTDENDYITWDKKKKRPLSTYITAYDTMKNIGDPGPSYENQSISKLETQTSQISSYENCKLSETPKTGSNIINASMPGNSGTTHYEDMNVAAGHESGEARKEEHLYAKITGTTCNIDNVTENPSHELGNGEGGRSAGTDDDLGMSAEYVECDRIYFDPDLDVI